MKFEGPKGFIRKLESIRTEWKSYLNDETKKYLIRDTFNSYLYENKMMKFRARKTKNYSQKEIIKQERENMNSYMQKIQDCLQESDFITFENIFIYNENQ